MKTTVEISDALILDAKRLAAREKTTVRALIEEGLRRVVRERRAKGPYRLRRASFRGDGLQAQVAEGTWETTRDLIYRGRGA